MAGLFSCPGFGFWVLGFGYAKSISPKPSLRDNSRAWKTRDAKKATHLGDASIGRGAGCLAEGREKRCSKTDAPPAGWRSGLRARSPRNLERRQRVQPACEMELHQQIAKEPAQFFRAIREHTILRTDIPQVFLATLREDLATERQENNLNGRAQRTQRTRAEPTSKLKHLCFLCVLLFKMNWHSVLSRKASVHQPQRRRVTTGVRAETPKRLATSSPPGSGTILISSVMVLMPSAE